MDICLGRLPFGVKAALSLVRRRWQCAHGLPATVDSDLDTGSCHSDGDVKLLYSSSKCDDLLEDRDELAQLRPRE